MDWKREAVDKLRGYVARQKSLDNIPDEIARLKTEYSAIRSATTDSTPVSGGGNKREDALLSNITHRQELNARLRDATLWIATVDSAMSVLDDNEKLVLNSLFVYRAKGNRERLSTELRVERSEVYRIKDRALRKFTIALYGITES